MGRPKDSSYRSYRLIYDALSNGPKCFEELWKLTKLHRNTVSTRLNHLVSEGLVGKRRSGHKVLYEIIEPLHNESGVLRSEGLKWLKYVWKITRKERRKRRRRLRELLKEQIKHEKLKAVIYGTIERLYDELDTIVRLPENKEILEIIPNWESIPIHKLWLLLSLNKILVSLSSQKLICPYCYHYGTVEDHERLEIVCPECSLVIGDETIPPEVRLKIISGFFQEHNESN